MIDWKNGTKEEHELSCKIAQRAASNGIGRSVLNISMDIIATHTNGCKLKLQSLLDADLGDFLHDVAGIGGNLNRNTGTLENCFLPRFAV